ncbi:Myosin-2 [Durusdinium trenchii]|uniref:Myosin-2 n=1 Tax=Durusdinium trenchii TaxID=1381693 RepID=A0ABP0HU80_9DINO
MGAMGSTPSRCCEGCGDREAAEAEEVVAKPWTEEPGPCAQPSRANGARAGIGPRSLLDVLQGKWFRKEDGQPVGDISGPYIVWHARWQFRESVSPLSEDLTGALVIDLDGQLHFGRPYFGPETLISWGDGDLWVKR